MPCSICTHTMQQVGESDVFWCPRCGSLMTVRGSLVETEAPYLVGRVRGLVMISRVAAGSGDAAAPEFLDTMAQHGVTESVFPPQDR